MEEIRSIPIDAIKVRRRIRRDPGDLTALMASLRKYGQLHPVVVDGNYQLIAGARRLEAARRLGWSTITALVTDKTSPSERLEIELEENLQRLNLAPEEIAEGYGRLERMLNPGPLRRALSRIWAFILRIVGKSPR